MENPAAAQNMAAGVSGRGSLSVLLSELRRLGGGVARSHPADVADGDVCEGAGWSSWCSGGGGSGSGSSRSSSSLTNEDVSLEDKKSAELDPTS